MNDLSQEIRSVVKERQLRHPPERVWRALTQKHLIEDWLMDNDFVPEVGHRFELRAAWGVVTGEVLVVHPYETLAYSWQARGLESVVTWTLFETEKGTRLHMEQKGFRTDQEQAYRGAMAGWNQFLERLQTVVSLLK